MSAPEVQEHADAAGVEGLSPSRPVPVVAGFAEQELLIGPSGGWRAVDLRELVRYRDLLYFMTLRGIKARYAQSALGVGWAIIQPLISTIIFTLIFGRLAGLPSNNLPYALFAFCGMVPWTFFSGALADGVNSLVRNAEMIGKVYFPRMVLPLSAVASKLIDLAIASVMLVVLMAYYRVAPGAGLALLPLVLLVLAATTVGLSLWLGALAVQYRDVAYGLNFAVQVLMYLSPVVYPASLIPSPYRWLYGLNPMAGTIEGLRSALTGHPAPPWDLLAVGAASSMALLVTGALYFRRMERTFADVA